MDSGQFRDWPLVRFAFSRLMMKTRWTLFRYRSSVGRGRLLLRAPNVVGVVS